MPSATATPCVDRPARRRAPPFKVSIVGGTGLLGHHAALECLRRGHAVHGIGGSDVAPGSAFPDAIRWRKADIFRLPKRELLRLFEGVDAMVYAVGPDDRVTPKAPAYGFFHERLVQGCGRVVAAAREAGVRRCVVLGSYDTHFDRLWPHEQLAAQHPYVRCRVEQAERAFDQGRGTMAVSVLELPYFFDVVPGRDPLWKETLLDRLLRMPVVVYPCGGSAMITAVHVGEAIAGAVECGRDGVSYPVGDDNLSWDEMLVTMLAALGIERRIVHLPAFAGAWLGSAIRALQARHGRESGLEPEHLFTQVLTDCLYLDAEPIAREFGYGRGGVRVAITETVRAC
jgi:nucleoside-diphosphate-sugar epimerase